MIKICCDHIKNFLEHHNGEFFKSVDPYDDEEYICISIKDKFIIYDSGEYDISRSFYMDLLYCPSCGTKIEDICDNTSL